jgi:hypothetical protein
MHRALVPSAVLLAMACAAPPVPTATVPRAAAPPTAAPCPTGEDPLTSTYPPAVSWTAPRIIGRQVVRDEDLAGGHAGRRINLDVKGADLEDVCRLLADVGRVNIVVADDVHEKVTVRMKGVPWDQALDVIVRTKGLRAARDGDIILVSK